MSDRTVHARAADGTQVVRYDRRGKWYVETADGMREQVTLSEAAACAVDIRADGGTVRLGMPGGSAFDRAVRKTTP